MLKSAASLLKALVASTFLFKFGAINRGFSFRKSIFEIRSVVWGLSVSSERPTGENATSAVPSALVVCVNPNSGFRVESEYSDCTAAT